MGTKQIGSFWILSLSSPSHCQKLPTEEDLLLLFLCPQSQLKFTEKMFCSSEPHVSREKKNKTQKKSQTWKATVMVKLPNQFPTLMNSLRSWYSASWSILLQNWLKMLLAAQTDLKFTSVPITDNLYRHRESRQEHGSLVVEFIPHQLQHRKAFANWANSWGEEKATSCVCQMARTRNNWLKSNQRTISNTGIKLKPLLLKPFNSLTPLPAATWNMVLPILSSRRTPQLDSSPKLLF